MVIFSAALAGLGAAQSIASQRAQNDAAIIQFNIAENERATQVGIENIRRREAEVNRLIANHAIRKAATNQRLLDDVRAHDQYRRNRQLISEQVRQAQDRNTASAASRGISSDSGSVRSLNIANLIKATDRNLDEERTLSSILFNNEQREVQALNQQDRRLIGRQRFRVGEKPILGEVSALGVLGSALSGAATGLEVEDLIGRIKEEGLGEYLTGVFKGPDLNPDAGKDVVSRADRLTGGR